MSKPNTYANRFITRMDYKSSGTYGWWVRFLRDNVLVAGKFFADRKHDGRNKALKQARAWRDEHEQGITS